METFEIVSCSDGDQCLNSVERLGIGAAKCGICRYAPNAMSEEMPQWRPVDGKSKHPAAVQAKKARKEERAATLRTQKLNRDRNKMRVLKKAVAAEKQTVSNFIRATKNSGRSNKDGDHTAVGQVTLDTKLQTGRENPVVLLDELAKVRLDAGRAGNWLGVLVLRNKYGKGVVAIDEVDFARLIKLLE